MQCKIFQTGDWVGDLVERTTQGHRDLRDLFYFLVLRFACECEHGISLSFLVYCVRSVGVTGSSYIAFGSLSSYKQLHLAIETNNNAGHGSC